MKEAITLSAKDEEELAGLAVDSFYNELETLLEDNGEVVVSLCGGTSIRKFYEKIPDRADRLSKEDWEKIHFFWTDERMVPPYHEDSNFRLADRLFLRDLGAQRLLLTENVHRFRGETENADEELARYDDELNELGGKIHIPILGVGKDCHVASLFPGHELLDAEREEFLMLDDSPKPPAARMTISPEHIRQSESPFLFFIGEEKEEALECFRDEEKDIHEFPCRLALEGEGTCYVVTDLQ